MRTDEPTRSHRSWDPVKRMLPAVRDTDLIYAVGFMVVAFALAFLWLIGGYLLGRIPAETPWGFPVVAGFFLASFALGGLLLYQITKHGRREERRDPWHHHEAERRAA